MVFFLRDWCGRYTCTCTCMITMNILCTLVFSSLLRFSYVRGYPVPASSSEKLPIHVDFFLFSLRFFVVYMYLLQGVLFTWIVLYVTHYALIDTYRYMYIRVHFHSFPSRSYTLSLLSCIHPLGLVPVYVHVCSYVRMYVCMCVHTICMIAFGWYHIIYNIAFSVIHVYTITYMVEISTQHSISVYLIRVLQVCVHVHVHVCVVSKMNRALSQLLRINNSKYLEGEEDRVEEGYAGFTTITS